MRCDSVILVLFSLPLLIGCERSDSRAIPSAPIDLVRVGAAAEPEIAEPLEVVTWTAPEARAAACSALEGLLLYDLTRPAAPRLLARVQPSLANGVFPRCQHVAYEPQSRRLYVAGHGDQFQPRPYLAAFAVAPGGEVREVARSARPEQVEGLDAKPDRLLVAAHTEGLLIFDPTAGEPFRERARVAELGNAWAVRSRGDLAWVADAGGQLVTVDLSEPGRPRVIARLALPGAPRAIALASDEAFVALGHRGFAVVSLAEPREPRLTAVVATPGSAVALDWDDARGALAVADWDALRIYRRLGDAPSDSRGDRRAFELAAAAPVPGVGGGPGRTLGVSTGDDLVVASGWAGLVTYLLEAGARPTPDERIDAAAPATRPAPIAPPPSANANTLGRGDAAAGHTLGLGDAVASLALDGGAGAPWRLADEPAPVVLLVYFATFCPVCTHEFADLESLLREYGEQGLAIIGLAPGGLLGAERPEQIEAFRIQSGATFPLVSERRHYARFAWPAGTSPFPRQVLLGPGPERRIRYLASRHDPAALENAIVESLARSQDSSAATSRESRKAK